MERTDIRCPHCKLLMFWEDEWHETLVCKKCGENFSPYKDFSQGFAYDMDEDEFYENYYWGDD